MSGVELRRSVAWGALLGAAAGLVAALGDFGALWLWLPLWRDRLGLLLRLTGTAIPLGAVAGACLGLAATAIEPLVTRVSRALGRGDPTREGAWRRRIAPLPWLAITLPGCALVAHLLMLGGKMSRMPAQLGMRVALTIALLAVSYVAILGAMRLRSAAAHLEPRRGRWLAAAIFALQIALTKIDQHVLPNLYGYLHACLAVAAFFVAMLGLDVLARTYGASRDLLPRLPRVAAVAGVALAGAFALNVATLDTNQNVRVALFDPRASSSRSLMQGIDPVLRAFSRASGEAGQRARPRRSRDLSAYGPLPTSPGAHVLLITVDALRPDHLGAWGYERPLSPNIDALAANAVLMERAYTQAPHSSYSLSSLFASEYLHETLDLGQPPPEATLASALADAGYHTAAFFTLGIFHTEGERLRRYRDEAFGFALHDHTDRRAEATTDRVLQEVARVVERGEPPTFFWVHYFDVHEPYLDTSFGTADMDRYDGEIRNVDRAIGRLMHMMEERLGREIVVALSSDHGEEFREHGGVYHGSTLYDEQTRVPLIIRAPGLSPRRVAAPVELVDLAPTLLGLVGVPVPDTMRGDDLRPLALGKVTDLGPAFSAVISKRMAVRWPYKIIADLRFSLFELYDLSEDPRERRNLANDRPELLAELKNEVYGWLDSLLLPPDASSEDAAARDPRALALDRGRLGDRRSTPDLAALVLDRGATVEQRTQAARYLGKLADVSTADALARALVDDQPRVRSEAAIALGRMYDPRARTALVDLILAEDPDTRVRASVSLGRLRDRRAVPGLIEALWAAETAYEREEAVRWLGRLKDPRAVEPLLALLPEFRIRALTAVALGRIGDRRVYQPLVQMLEWETHADIRESAVEGLGRLGDPRAVPALVALAPRDVDLETTGETLVRLNAIGAGAIGGLDFYDGVTGLAGFSRCYTGPLEHDWDYLHRTWCETRDPRASFNVSVPQGVADSATGVTVIVSLKRSDATDPTSATLHLGPHALPLGRIDGRFRELRLTLPRGALGRGGLRASIDVESPAHLVLDHVLIVPTGTATN